MEYSLIMFLIGCILGSKPVDPEVAARNAAEVEQLLAMLGTVKEYLIPIAIVLFFAVCLFVTFRKLLKI